MKILYLSPIHPSLAPGDPLPRWQTQASHVRALRSLGHEVRVVTYAPRKNGRPNLAQRAMGNVKVLGISGSFDAIFLSFGADVLLPLTVRDLVARCKCPLVILSGVSPMTQGNPRERALAPLATLVVTNAPSHAEEWKALGARAIVLPISAIDPGLHFSRLAGGQARPNIRRDLDVVFAGTLTKDREDFFRTLRRHLSPSVSLAIEQFVWEEKFARLLSRAKISLNPIRPSMRHGANLRLFEVPAFGAMELSSFSNSEWLVPGKEIVTYDSPKDAAAKIAYYLRYPRERERIARAGRRRVLREHTFAQRFRKLIDILQTMSNKQ